MLRWLLSAAIGLCGVVGVVGLSIGMNAVIPHKATEPVSVLTEVAVPPKPHDAAKKRARKEGPKKAARRLVSSASTPLAASLSGLDFGMAGPEGGSFADATQALMGTLGSSVVNEEDVQEAPQPIQRTPPSFPARARAAGQSGSVTLSFVVDVDGSTQDVHVVEATPPGVFDDAAVDAVRQWRFQPGLQEGAPVAVRVRQTLRFELE